MEPTDRVAVVMITVVLRGRRELGEADAWQPSFFVFFVTRALPAS